MRACDRLLDQFVPGPGFARESEPKGMPGALDRGHRFTLQGVAISFQLDIDKEPIGAVAMRCPERFARERN